MASPPGSLSQLVEAIRASNPIQTLFLFLVVANHLLSPLDNHWLTSPAAESGVAASGAFFAMCEVLWLGLFNFAPSSLTIFVTTLILHATMLAWYFKAPARDRGALLFYATAATSAGLNCCLFVGASELSGIVDNRRDIDPFVAPTCGMLVVVTYIALKAITRDIVIGDWDDVAELPCTPMEKRLQAGVALVALRSLAPVLLAQGYYLFARAGDGSLALATDGSILHGMAATKALWAYRVNLFSLAKSIMLR